jgi:hypothetical protein
MENGEVLNVGIAGLGFGTAARLWARPRARELGGG